MNNSSIANGSGLIRIGTDIDTQKLMIDFSGNEFQSCFRNDASVLFFIANSYKQSYTVIGHELEKRFKANSSSFSNFAKNIAHLVFPYCFNFRHYVELELKALIVAFSISSPSITHNLNILSRDLSNCIENLSYKSDAYELSYDDFNLIKNDLLQRTKTLEELIRSFSESEPSVEYYRFVFEKKKKSIVLKNPYITFDFCDCKTQYKDIENRFDAICDLARRISRILCI